jgi:hypothetical protein
VCAPKPKINVPTPGATPPPATPGADNLQLGGKKSFIGGVLGKLRLTRKKG